LALALLGRDTSIRGQLWASFGLFVALLAAGIGYILYELDLRRHDYQILNLAGQIKVDAGTLRQQAEAYLGTNVFSLAQRGAGADLALRALRERVDHYDQVVMGFKARELKPELTGRAEPLRCNWDERSRDQLDVTVAFWEDFRKGLDAAMGDDLHRPHLAEASRYILARGDALIENTDNLALAFQAMMEGKLRRVNALVAGMLVLALALAALILLLFRHRVLKPLDATLVGFARVAGGDLGHQVPRTGAAEIGRMTEAFNRLSERLHALFGLTDRINRGHDLNETLRFIREEFSGFLPVDWVAVLLASPDGHHFSVERVSGAVHPFHGQREVCSPMLDQAVSKGRPVLYDAPDKPPDNACDLVNGFAHEGLASALLLPLADLRDGGAVLAFASRQVKAYTPAHQDFLESIGAQVSHILGKTVIMEGLVVAAIQGLAKLAESRDPETGDHLVRMSLYSAIVAEELGKTQDYADLCTPAYVRALHEFAPMHDIGKVGIVDSVLLKPGRLDDAQLVEMRKHPTIGAEVLRLCEARMNERGRSVFKVGIEIAESHHEKWDGSGYPHGIKGSAIPLSARIVAVADVFDALTSKRPYKDAWPLEKALDTVRKDSGTHFDPQVIEAFQAALPRILEIYERHKHV